LSARATCSLPSKSKHTVAAALLGRARRIDLVAGVAQMLMMRVVCLSDLAGSIDADFCLMILGRPRRLVERGPIGGVPAIQRHTPSAYAASGMVEGDGSGARTSGGAAAGTCRWRSGRNIEVGRAGPAQPLDRCRRRAKSSPTP